MKIRDEDAWFAWRDGNTDSYGGACIAFAERWADRMEDALAWGEPIADSAERTSHEADTEGITGFMFGAACGVLLSCWAHADELRPWVDARSGAADDAREG